MRFWAKSLRIFKCLCDHGRQSVRRIAQQTGLSKSSVHRLQHAMERRNRHPESWFWETADGRQWLTRLVVATLYTFGLKRGVGLDTMSEFFARLHLATQVGCSPSALRGVMQALEGSVAKFDFWAKSKNWVSGIQRLTDSQTLEKATLRQNQNICIALN